MIKQYQNSVIAQLLEAIISQVNFNGEPISNIGDILLSILEQTPYDKEPKSVLAELFLKLKDKLEGRAFTPYDKEPRSAIAEILLSILNETEYDKQPNSRIAELLLELKAELEDYAELTASGAIANFTTSVVKPLVNLTAYFNATQEAGTPTPQSPKAISGVSAVNVAHLSGSENTSTAFRGLLLGTHDFIELSQLTWSYVEANKAFIATDLGSVIKKPANTNIMPYFISSKYTVVKRADIEFGTSDKVITEQITGSIIACDLNYTDAQTFANSLEGEYLIYELETPKTPTITPEQFNALCTSFGVVGNVVTIALGGTYYGGYVSQDKNGKRELVITHDLIDLGDYDWVKATSGGNTVFYMTLPNGSQNNYPTGLCTNYEILRAYSSDKVSVLYGSVAYNFSRFGIRDSDYDNSSVTEFKTAMAGVLLVYELAEPFTVELPDGEPIVAFNGVNNVYNDSGDTSVTYLALISDNITRSAKARATLKAEKLKAKEIEEQKEQIVLDPVEVIKEKPTKGA